MNISQIEAEENLIVLVDLVKARGRATIPEIATALGLKRSTAKDHVRTAVLLGVLVETSEQDFDSHAGKPGPAPHFFRPVPESAG